MTITIDADKTVTKKSEFFSWKDDDYESEKVTTTTKEVVEIFDGEGNKISSITSDNPPTVEVTLYRFIGATGYGQERLKSRVGEVNPDWIPSDDIEEEEKSHFTGVKIHLQTEVLMDYNQYRAGDTLKSTIYGYYESGVLLYEVETLYIEEEHISTETIPAGGN